MKGSRVEVSKGVLFVLSFVLLLLILIVVMPFSSRHKKRHVEGIQEVIDNVRELTELKGNLETSVFLTRELLRGKGDEDTLEKSISKIKIASRDMDVDIEHITGAMKNVLATSTYTDEVASKAIAGELEEVHYKVNRQLDKIIKNDSVQLEANVEEDYKDVRDTMSILVVVIVLVSIAVSILSKMNATISRNKRRTSIFENDIGSKIVFRSTKNTSVIECDFSKKEGNVLYDGERKR